MRFVREMADEYQARMRLEKIPSGQMARIFPAGSFPGVPDREKRQPHVSKVTHPAGAPFSQLSDRSFWVSFFAFRLRITILVAVMSRNAHRDLCFPSLVRNMIGPFHEKE